MMSHSQGEKPMKRKTLFLLSILTISATILSGCKSADSVENSETSETTAIESETTEETEAITETVEESETETEVSDDNTSTSETNTGTTRTDYPDSNPDHQAAWDYYKENWDDFSVYGTTTKGKVKNDFPYYGPTGYDVTLLEYRTTDKGYTVMYDTETGRVYYTGMMLPTGNSWIERESGSAAVITQYIIDNNLTGIYDITYAQFQELLGVYNGD